MEVGERAYRLTCPLSAEALIDEADFERDERLPYWADLWPSAVALARHVAGRDLSGKRVIELGCGLGLPAVVALDRGAEVVATDHYGAALDFAAHNARANTGRELRTALLDWHAPKLESLGAFDLVLAADVLYEPRNVGALVGLVPELLAPEGEAVFADPRRKDAPEFLEQVRERDLRGSTEKVLVEDDGREVGILLHRLWRQPWQ